MDFIVRKASDITSDELAERGLTGIPSDWPVDANPVPQDGVPDGWTLMSDNDVVALKVANQAAYDAWIISSGKVDQPPVPKPSPRQIRLWLLSINITSDMIEEKIALLSEPMKSQAQITWRYAQYYEYNHPLLLQLAASFGLNASQLRAGFFAAALL